MTKTVVILGASFAGVPIAHHLLAHQVPLIPDLKIILVSPNTHLYWAPAAVRGIVPGTGFDDKLFYPIAPGFAKYPSGKFEFVLGTAEALDTTSKIVAVRTTEGAAREIPYHTLVIATGTSAKEDMPFKTISTTEHTRDVLRDWQHRIEAAKSIVVAGAGITGIEVAGELAEVYGKKAGGKKKITLVGADVLPLHDEMTTSVRQAAKKSLEKMGVHVVLNAKVTEVEDNASSGKTLTLSLPGGKKDTLETNVLIPTYGLQPNTSFVPGSMLDHRGFVKQTKFLRAEGHDDIFVVGDVGNLETPQSMHTENQTVHVVKSLAAQLKGEQVPEYTFSKEVGFGASLGPGGGVGQMFGWKLPGFVIKYAKGKTLATDRAPAYVEGKRTLMQSKWA
ncbi:FAD/NAD(P)-binding domain-containing protein [Cryphonectria parasitica EP155]|uniref:FAD/NAD(P)-binding domain-containing protein n=1 Tax=Cryphonectria parasitica (strain ATCC 38755 / EP155) TaxID=660469 RepID=A0A9P4YCL0_CRYP1|nr:FAD/NAD(P)-binding domain-containing protein [Cryphonectria parasitica EP155]KAF3770881.1 FAD/NAD(P)-binding domain-containing protein [Cryphonectria parasitica EP155]